MYNKKYNDNLKKEDITDYKIHKFLKPECTNVFKEFVDRDTISHFVVEDEVKEVIERLNQNHNLLYVSAGHPNTMESRDKMLGSNFPSYTSKQLVMLRDKHLLNVDVLIDDCLDNFKGFKGFKILYDAPWNRKGVLGVDYDYRAYNFKDVEKAIKLLALDYTPKTDIIDLNIRYKFKKGNIELLNKDQILCLNEVIKSDNIDSVYVLYDRLLTIIKDDDYEPESKVYGYYVDYLRNNNYKDIAFMTFVKEDITDDDYKNSTVILKVE